MNKKLKLNKTLGILGGGQLASMLTHSAQKLGYRVSVYSSSKSDPATERAHSHCLGSLEDSKKIIKWSQNCDVVTFESEFIDLKKAKLRKAQPSVKNMFILRDRLSQKQLLEKFKIPTSPFSIATDSPFEKSQVFKQRLFGYDGYGTKLVKNKKAHGDFLKSTAELTDWIQEDFIPFKRELAFSIARTKNNSFCLLPLVESFQKDSKCFYTKGPMEHKKLSSLVLKFKKMMSEINYIGILAVELFETKEGELLVNELAPRVHNSAHYSIEALHLSQFDVHNLAVLGEDLPAKIPSLSPFAMVNLIGSCSKRPELTLPSKGSLHWYGKSPNKPGRKMGHITVLDNTSSSALKSALREEKRQNL